MAVYDDENTPKKPVSSGDSSDTSPEQQAEEAAKQQDDYSAPAATKGEQQEKTSLASKLGKQVDEPESDWVTSAVGGGKGASSKRRRNLLLGLGGGGGFLVVIVALVAMMIFLAQLKSVHYSTVLRSTGFAASQLVMRKTFSTIAYNNAVLTEDSLGSVSQPERTMLDRLRKINPEKTMKMLGREGQFNIVLENGKEAGFEIRGKRFMKDEFAREAFPDRANYKDLSYREKLTVKNNILNQVGDEMADILATEPRSFNNGFFKGFRQHFNIRTSKWASKARDLAGKSQKEARSETRSQTVEEITEGEKPQSSIADVDEAADVFEEEVKTSVKNNLDQRGKDYASAAFKKAGIDDIVSFSDTAGKVSIGVMTTTMYCTARDIQGSLEEINTRKEEQAQRFSHDIQTTGQQIASGEVNIEAVTAANSMWDGSADIPSADQSPLYKEDTGKSLAGVDTTALMDQSPTAKIADTPLKTIIEIGDTVFVNIPIPALKDKIIDEGCKGILRPDVQLTIAGVDVIASIGAAVVTGGTSEGVKVGIKTAATAAIGIYGGNWLGEWLSETISTYAGGDFTGAETGIDRYNAGAIATNYQNAAVARGVTYGRPLTTEEAIDTKTTALNDLRHRETNGSFANRYFAIDNPYSLVGNVASSMPSSSPAVLASTQRSLTNLGNRFASLLSGSWGLNTALAATGLQQKVSAQSYQNVTAANNFFNIDQWGWTNEEFAKLANLSGSADENGVGSFDYVKNGAWVLEHNANGELDAKFNKCYTPAAQNDVPDGCTAEDLSTEEALRWRIYKLYDSAINQLADTTVTEDNADGGGNFSTGAIDGNLPSGTKEELLDQIEATGNITSGFSMLNTQVKRTTLAVILKLAQKYKFTINSVIRSGAGPHGNGSAVDVGNINGKGVPTGQDYNAYNEEANEFIRDAATLLPGKSWIGVSNDQFKKTANDIMIPKGGSSDLDLPSTTGATGAHFHLNSPADAE